MNQEHNQEQIVRYWHAVELLQPQAAPKISKRDKPYQPFFHDTPAAPSVMPWSEESPVSRETLPRQRVWSHTLYAHLYDSRDVAEKLKALFGADSGYSEPQQRESALFAMKFNAEGWVLEDSFVLSSEAWFLGRALAGKDWTQGFDEDQQRLRDRLKERMGATVSSAALEALTREIRHFLGLDDFFGELGQRRHRFRSAPVKVDKPEPEDDPLNSFLLPDLAAIAGELGRAVKSVALDQYLSRHNPENRLHLDTDQASLPLIEQLSSERYASACWPSPQHLGLVHSQQLAVNTILNRLSDSEGLLGVNGPPGTGKTTLLRDLIAAIVTQRADALASLSRASDAFIADCRESANENGRLQHIYKLQPALYGFEIVVASSNNGAVENVTLELPQLDKIDDSWLPDADYFSELGELLTEKPAWGLISAALGNKSKRGQFVSRFFYGQQPDNKTANKPPATSHDDTRREVAGAEKNQTTELAPDRSPVIEQDKTPPGFRNWLTAQTEPELNPEQRKAIWQKAVAGYEAAKNEAARLSARTLQVYPLVETLTQTRQRISVKEEDLKQLGERLARVLEQLEYLDTSKWITARDALEQNRLALQAALATKPGFWANLFSLWGAQRRWKSRHGLLLGAVASAQAEFERVQRIARRLQAEQQQLETSNADGERELERLREQARSQQEQISALASAHRAGHLLAWLQTGAIGRGEAIELAEPWIIAGWREARARVFIEALKLHRTFFMLEARRIRANLTFITNLLNGNRFQGLSRDAIRSAWASLFMVVPVLSSTFASFARTFGSLRAGEIGWLFVDEAGQATPQAAVGALWRARRAVLVGDPLQLKPIVTVSDAVLEHMRTRYQVDMHWLPNRQSAQTLADEATDWGRAIGPRGAKRWVGLPLVVHRRCDRPMYALANRIAYDGAMVYGTGTPPPAKETRASLASGWIHVTGPSTGNWVPAEGDALGQLLALLQADGVTAQDISVITPFQDVRQRLRSFLSAQSTYGTIHTMQGKEAPVVIMVLGGNTSSPGARNWVVAEPNLLNVAATRAKRRFYVIGDAGDWAGRNLFCEVMDLLPVQRLPSPAESETVS